MEYGISASQLEDKLDAKAIDRYYDTLSFHQDNYSGEDTEPSKPWLTGSAISGGSVGSGGYRRLILSWRISSAMVATQAATAWRSDGTLNSSWIWAISTLRDGGNLTVYVGVLMVYS
jgi:hypothetical protein